MKLTNHIPGVTPGKTRRNLVVGLIYLLLLPFVIVAAPFYLLYAVGTNRNGLADSLADSPLAAIPTIQNGGWQSGITLFVATVVILAAFGAIVPADINNGGESIESGEVTADTVASETTDSVTEQTATSDDNSQQEDQQNRDSGDQSVTEAGDEEAEDEAGDEEGDENEEVETPSTDGILEVHAINVGQADATLFVAPSGETMLIDSGDWSDDGETVLDYLDAQEIEQIDHLVSTHGHADHIGGHAAVIERYETEKEGIGQVWDSGVTHTTQTYERYLDAVEEYNVTLLETQEGDEIPIDGVNATVLNPPADSELPDDLHYNSVVLLIEHGEVGFLWTGDIEDTAEQRLIDEYGEELEAEIYHAGHHGSSTSSTTEFLDAVNPEVSVISSAYDSQFEHPHDEVLDRFATHDIAAVWTGVHGSTVFRSDGEEYNATVQAHARTNPLQLRDEPAVTADPTVPPMCELDLNATAGIDMVDEDSEEDDSETDDSEEGIDEEDRGENLHITPNTPGSAAEHIWEYDVTEFSGSVDEIVVEYPDGTSLDGLTESDVTVTMSRSLSDGLDTSEISVNQDTYAGSSATFDLSGVYNTEIAGYVEVRIDGVENPGPGDYTATITLLGEEDELSITEEFTIE